jgi:hypothetical protein
MGLVLISVRGWAACPLSTFPENHKLDQEITNICQNELNPVINNATIQTAAVTSLSVSTVTAVSSATVKNLSVTNINGAAYSAVTAGQLPATATNDNAAAGKLGEYVSSFNTYPNNTPATTVWGDGTSISLTAGDWDVTAVLIANNKATTTTDIEFGISQTAGNSTTGLGLGDNWQVLAQPVGSASPTLSGCIANYRQSLSGTTTIYLKIMATFTGTIPSFGCRLSARRVR